jgi:hypothetical protein
VARVPGPESAMANPDPLLLWQQSHPASVQLARRPSGLTSPPAPAWPIMPDSKSVNLNPLLLQCQRMIPSCASVRPNALDQSPGLAPSTILTRPSAPGLFIVQPLEANRRWHTSVPCLSIYGSKLTWTQHIVVRN